MSIKKEKQQWKEEKKAQIENMVDSFNKEIESFTYDPKLILEYINFRKNFKDYSFMNQVLIHKQLPKANYIASFKKWKEMDINVKKGQKAIRILAPFFKTIYEDKNTKEIYTKDTLPKNYNIKDYEISKRLVGYNSVPVFADIQTDIKMEQYPQLDITIFETYSKDDYEHIINATIDFLKENNTMVFLNDKDIDIRTGGYFSVNDNKIVVSDNAKFDAKLQILFHEMAHSLLHNNKQTVTVQKDKQIAEVQAETVAYILLNYFTDIDAEKSKGYVKGWSMDLTPEERLIYMKETIETSINAIDKIEEKIELNRSMNIEKSLDFTNSLESKINYLENEIMDLKYKIEDKEMDYYYADEGAELIANEINYLKNNLELSENKLEELNNIKTKNVKNEVHER